jgi:hypothetical protein
VKFQRKRDDADFRGLSDFMKQYRCGRWVLVSRETSALDEDRILVVPLRDFLLAYCRRGLPPTLRSTLSRQTRSAREEE